MTWLIIPALQLAALLWLWICTAGAKPDRDDWTILAIGLCATVVPSVLVGVLA